MKLGKPITTPLNENYCNARVGRYLQICFRLTTAWNKEMPFRIVLKFALEYVISKVQENRVTETERDTAACRYSR
jgi:hypothetical protein